MRVLVIEGENGAAADESPSELRGTEYYQVEAAPSVDWVLEERGKLRPDAIVWDIEKSDGPALRRMEELRMAFPSLPVLLLMSQSTGAHSSVSLPSADGILQRDLPPWALSRNLQCAVEKLRAEERQRQVEEVINALPYALIVVSPTNKILFVNRSAIELFQEKRAHMVGQPLPFCIAPDAASEVTVVRKGVERICELQVNDILWRGEAAQLASLHDITDQEALKQQLMISDRMAALGTLVAGVAHEINNPLAALMANLELAADALVESGIEGEIAKRCREELTDAQEATRRIQQIVRDLHVFSRAGADVAEATDPTQVIAAGLRIARREIPGRASLRLDYQWVPDVLANESRLGQVIVNLLVNAGQAIPEDGRKDHEIAVRVRSATPSRVTVEVSDTGNGVPTEVQKRLFTSHVTTKAPGAGSGLGLAICHRIVSAFGGQMTCESEVGRGACFRFDLPAAASGDDRRRSNASPLRRSDGRPARVLVLDSHPMVLAEACAALARSCEVVGFQDPESALTSIASEGAFDCIFCEIMMPHFDGRTFYERVAAINRAYPARIVFARGGVLSSAAGDFMASVGNWQVVKPYDSAVLRSVVMRKIDLHHL